MPTVTSLEKSLTVLEAIFHHRDGIGTRALASQLNLNVATIHNIARTFCRKGYLRQDPVTKVFLPGIRLMLLGRHPSYLRSLSLAAAHIVEEVAKTLNESVLLASLDHSRILNLKYVPSRQALRVAESDDMSDHAHAIAVGKVLLTSLTETELDSYLHETTLQSFTPRTLATPDLLRGELKKVQSQGYAWTQDEYREGISALAVPILDPWGSIVAAIGASAPTVRLASPDQFSNTLEELTKAAAAIEKQWKQTHQSRPGDKAPKKPVSPGG